MLDGEEDDVAEQDEELESEEPANDDDQAEEEETPEANDTEEDEDVVTFAGADLRAEDEPEGIRNLREALKREKARVKELEGKTSAAEEETAGPEPTMDDEDVQWDQDAFKAKWRKWNDRQQAIASKKTEAQQQAEQAQREWEEDVSELFRQRSSLKVRDFDTAQDRVAATLSEPQQAVLTMASKNKAALWYALGKNPERLEALAKVTNLAKFAAEVGRLDVETKVSKRKPETQPERRHTGSGPVNSGGGDAKLERLQREYEKTGNGTEYFAYKRQLAAKKAA